MADLITAATPITPHFVWGEAIKDPGMLSPGQQAGVRALARQLECLRLAWQRNPVTVRKWVAMDGGHENYGSHATGLNVDIGYPAKFRQDTATDIARKLGFTVVQPDRNTLHLGLVSVEDAAPEIALVEQSPEVGAALIFQLAGFDAKLAERLGALAWAALSPTLAEGVDLGLFLGFSVQEGGGRPTAYRSEGRPWWERNIRDGKLFDKAKHPDVIDLDVIDQWGSAGAWQMLRSTAIDLGFPASQKWAERLDLKPTGETDMLTGRPREAMTGTFKGPFSEVAVAASYSTRYLRRLLDRYAGDDAEALAVAAYNAGPHNVDVAQHRAGARWLDVLGEVAKNPVAHTYAPSVLAHAKRARAALASPGLARLRK